MTRRHRVTLLLAWLLALAVVTTVPWSDLQDHGHWDRVNWVPFLGEHDELRDVILNILAFVPLGLLGPARSRWGLAAVTAAAVLLASTAEIYQVYTHGRIPSATDIAAAGMGASLGSLVASARSRPRRRTTAQRA